MKMSEKMKISSVFEVLDSLKLVVRYGVGTVQEEFLKRANDV